MKKKIQASILILTCITVIAVIGYMIIGNPAVFINNQKLQSSIKSINSESARLNDVIPFEWDSVYTFAPYESIFYILKE